MGVRGCTDRDDANGNMRAPMVGHDSFRQDAGKGGGYGGAPPARDWHMAVKEYVRNQLYAEMEPLKVQVAVLQKQLVVLDEKSKAIVPARSNSRKSDNSELAEKKLEDMNPRLEEMMNQHDAKLNETNSRLAEAERVLRDFGAINDKFARRHDSLVECVQDLDGRLDQVDKAQQKAAQQVPSPLPHGMLPSVPENYAAVHEAEGHSWPAQLPPGPVPPPGGSGFHGAPPPPGGSGFAGKAPTTPHHNAPSGNGKAALIWTASEHQASLEVEEFSFQVDRIPGMPLGMILRNDGSKLVVDQISEGTHFPIAPGDRIVAIDGIRGESQSLLDMIKRTGTFQISCQRLLSTTL